MLCEKCNASVPDAPSNSSPDVSSSSLQNLLRAQNSLTPSDISEIRDIIDGLDVDTHRISWELISLTNKLKRLEIQQVKYKSLLAPIRRLPSEILHLIFTLFSCDPDMQNIMADSNHVSLPGYTLMAVCSRWRNIALSCPALWQKLRLTALLSDNTRENQDNLASLAAPLKWCLDHAGGTESLEISFRAVMGSNDDAPAPEPEFMRSLFAQSARWRYLNLSLDFTNLEMFPSFAALKNCAFPSLKSLQFCVKHEGLTKFDIFRAAPQLTQLTLSTLPAVERNVMFPWGQIKTLELSFVDPDYELFEALAFCPSLETLSYVFSYYEDDSFEIPPQFSETICSLSVSFMEIHYIPETLSVLMDAACFPALQEMSINYEELYSETLWPQAKVISFLLRSGCSLTTLEIGNVIISNEDLAALLGNTPELRRFNFHEGPKGPASHHQLITMSFIARLHAYRDIEDIDYHGFANPLVPKLEHLSLRVLADWFNVDQVFIDVICSRWSPELSVVAMTGIDCLKSVKLTVMGRELNEEVYKPLILLRKAGLQVELEGTAH
ncbi:hypothetical protein BDP27DRAFT_1413804 [Rhodocollybia butyracea]|uniref:F-box domain-containing protein n=1 Tax=Rhodocollybia butyracea TaxID=206335 RepID=A0A9P5Q3E6_9AGAR|nr:hypothetical protein BDP27DRAFT_1413804 [Rhodocollybia butyracea]